MNDVFPVPPRSFYRAFMVSLVLHLLLATSLMISRGSGRYITPGGRGRAKVIWVKPGGGKAKTAKSRALPPPPAVAKPAPRPKKNLTKSADKKSSQQKKRADNKTRQRALKEIEEMERKRLLASALSDVESTVAKNDESTQAGKTEEAAGEGDGSGETGEGGGLAESGYARQVKEVYINEMNVLYKTRFSGKNLSAKVKVEIDGEGNVVKHKLIENSGDLYFDAAVRVIMERVKVLPPPPADFVAEGMILDFSPP